MNWNHFISWRSKERTFVFFLLFKMKCKLSSWNHQKVFKWSQIDLNHHPRFFLDEKFPDKMSLVFFHQRHTCSITNVYKIDRFSSICVWILIWMAHEFNGIVSHTWKKCIYTYWQNEELRCNCAILIRLLSIP